jgi:predicted RNA-binding Zn-ribbon protein involved in translation (DUF1610 family)
MEYREYDEDEIEEFELHPCPECGSPVILVKRERKASPKVKCVKCRGKK